MRALASLLLACAARVAVAAPAVPPAPAPGSLASAAATASRRFPNPTLVTHDGERVRFHDDLLKGRCVLIHFAYTRCTGSCPRSTANLLAVERLLRARGYDIPLLTVSLDPENDTPEAARRYVRRHGSPPGWRYLTGTREDLEALRVFLGFTDKRPEIDADRSQHLAMVMIGNERVDRWVGMPARSRAEVIAAAAIRTASERGDQLEATRLPGR